MAILNLADSDFVLYSSFSRDYLNIHVEFDHDFVVALLKKLKRIYFTQMIHEICINKKLHMGEDLHHEEL